MGMATRDSTMWMPVEEERPGFSALSHARERRVMVDARHPSAMGPSKMVMDDAASMVVTLM